MAWTINSGASNNGTTSAIDTTGAAMIVVGDQVIKVATDTKKPQGN